MLSLFGDCCGVGSSNVAPVVGAILGYDGDITKFREIAEQFDVALGTPDAVRFLNL